MNQQAMMRLKKCKTNDGSTGKLEQTVYSGTAGGGMVCVRMKGNHEMVSVTIDPDAIESKEDIELLQDTIVAAVNDATKKSRKNLKKR